jgi:hypothetical protein
LRAIALADRLLYEHERRFFLSTLLLYMEAAAIKIKIKKERSEASGTVATKWMRLHMTGI